ncbi:MAG: hypothetical protein K0Q89_176 [Thermomicrobiales bacterium]|nr:hypothetical protein [Thermomicrobiales bacterium]
MLPFNPKALRCDPAVPVDPGDFGQSVASRPDDLFDRAGNVRMKLDPRLRDDPGALGNNCDDVYGIDDEECRGPLRQNAREIADVRLPADERTIEVPLFQPGA